MYGDFRDLIEYVLYYLDLITVMLVELKSYCIGKLLAVQNTK